MEKYEHICKEVYYILEQSPEINPDNYDTEQVIELNEAVKKAIDVLETVVVF